MRKIALILALAAALPAENYRRAPDNIRAVLDAPPAAQLFANPPGTWVIAARGRRYPPISELAAPMLRLAGERIDPRTNGPHRATRYVSFELRRLDDGGAVPLRLPAGARMSAPRWSPDGRRFAALRTTESGVELWVGSTSGEIRALPGIRVNAAYGEPLQWLDGGSRLLVQTIPAGRGAVPAEPSAPAGPLAQETAGKAGPSRTLQDLLKNPHDESLFEYLATSQLTAVDADTGSATAIGRPAIFTSTEGSPDGKHLLVRRLRRPYSYLLEAADFPHEVEVWNLEGAREKTIASQPMRERVPIDGVAVGPRLHQWKTNEPATLVWVEALDEGDPRKQVPHRDRALQWSAPFDGEPKEWLRTVDRWASVRWLADGRALVTDSDRRKRRTRMRLIGPGLDKELWARNSQDRYNDPGDPVTHMTPPGARLVRQSGDWIFLEGEGATPQGDRPFLDRFHLMTGAKERLFQCDEQSYETVAAVLSADGARLLTRRESPVDPPNYLVRSSGKIERKLTDDRDPTPELRQIERRLIKYKRADGVPLSFTLNLPPGYVPGTRLPAVVWAYPRDYGDAGTAGQVSGSTKRFTTIAGPSHLFFLLAGYAILDGAAMPVIGSGETANDTYLDQIVASAKAAIDQGSELGVIDPKRVGVGGHSYGAFMTANLLAHSDLFRAGIARSGAYNRTLTPFGFQAESRTLWEARDIYLRMSPFLAADKINEPVLLIHGEADNNAGTFPIQSDRMYQAIRGNGGTVRYVVLPHESHSYEARESVEHTIAEMIAWFDRHVKSGGPR